MICPECGNGMVDTAIFCSKCGYKLKKNENEKIFSCDREKMKMIAVSCCICIAVLIYFSMFHMQDSDWVIMTGENGGAVITEYKGEEENVIIPQTLKKGWRTFDVTYIGYQAFLDCNSLKSVELPDGVIEIWGEAFNGCSSLSSIELPDSVTEIREHAFFGCSSLSSIELPDSVTEIGEYAFEGCSSLSSIVLPDGVTRVWNDAFSGCNGLKNIELPDSVTEIGSGAFSGCSSLNSIELPDSVTYIGSWAFEGCSSLSSIELPDGVTEIGASTFLDCDSLKSIELPDSVTKIGSGAFSDCDNLSYIEIPESVIEIGEGIFSGCPRLIIGEWTSNELSVFPKIVRDFLESKGELIGTYDSVLMMAGVDAIGEDEVGVIFTTDGEMKLVHGERTFNLINYTIIDGEMMQLQFDWITSEGITHSLVYNGNYEVSGNEMFIDFFGYDIKMLRKQKE